MGARADDTRCHPGFHQMDPGLDASEVSQRLLLLMEWSSCLDELVSRLDDLGEERGNEAANIAPKGVKVNRHKTTPSPRSGYLATVFKSEKDESKIEATCLREIIFGQLKKKAKFCNVCGPVIFIHLFAAYFLNNKSFK